MQTIQDIIDNMPADRLAPVLASLITPSAQEELQRLLAIKPSKANLATMALRDKHKGACDFLKIKIRLTSKEWQHQRKIKAGKFSL